MQTSALNLLGVQFLSRPVIREDLLRFGAKVTASQGLSLTGTLTIKFGNPLLEAPANWTPGPGGSSKNVAVSGTPLRQPRAVRRSLCGTALAGLCTHQL